MQSRNLTLNQGWGVGAGHFAIGGAGAHVKI